MTDAIAPLRFFVPGRPKTKGSMVARPNGSMRENVAGSGMWRQLMAYAAKLEMRRRPDVRWPLAGPVSVRALFWLPVTPIGARVGDIDKLCRNLLDALDDAGVYADDVQVVDLVARKMQVDDRGADVSGPGLNPGVSVTVAW